MDKKTIYIIAIAIIIFAGVYYLQSQKSAEPQQAAQEQGGGQEATTMEEAEKTPAPAPTQQKPKTQTPSLPQTGEVIVKINRFSFTPSVTTIRKGSVITWVNMDNQAHQVASDPHPVHSDLPGLESKVLSYGQSYSFTFLKSGVFGYHDHINPLIKGTIIVTD